MSGLIFGNNNRTNAHTQPAATSLRVLTSNNGMALPLVYGRTRVPGNLIWYGDFLATAQNSSSGGGGKGGGGGGSAGGGSTSFTYLASVIIGICEGPIGGIGTIWRGKKVIDGAALDTVQVPTTVTENHTVPASGTLTVNHASSFVADGGVTCAGVSVPIDGGAGEGGSGGSGSTAGGAGCCFPAGTLVRMADGALKPIERIRIGERVLGLHGFVNEVRALQPVALGDRDLCSINDEIFTTADHPFWTDRGWGVLSRAEYIANDYGKAQRVVVDDVGRSEVWNYAGISLSGVGEYGAGARIGFGPDGYRDLTRVSRRRASPATRLYSLVLGGSHTMLLRGAGFADTGRADTGRAGLGASSACADGYVFSGWARDDDFDYARGRVRELAA
jgi:hypothetical protein